MEVYGKISELSSGFSSKLCLICGIQEYQLGWVGLVLTLVLDEMG
jgi:hypothetical protein